jgi:hypothetical protein
MTPEEWHKIKEVLQNALEIDPQVRRNFLDSACAGETFVNRSRGAFALTRRGPSFS